MAVALSLKSLRCPEGVGQERRGVDRAPFSIGRGTESDWVLPDPDKILSKRHCRITAKGETWLITDISSNGTFLNGNALDPELPHPLRDHDRLSLGKYEFEVRVVETYDDDASEAPTRFGNWSEKVNQKRLTSDPFPPSDVEPEEAAHPSIGLPQDFDSLSESDRLAEHPYAARDDTPDVNSHFDPPRPSLALLPEDWDEEDNRASGLTQLENAESPSADPPASPVTTATNANPATDVNLQPSELPPREGSLPESVEATAPRQPKRPALRREKGVDSVSDEGGFAAFADGAGYRGPLPGDTRDTLRRLGSAFRAMISGLRHSMIARARVKNEFRIDQTMIRAVGNNPIKFAADDDDALAAMIGVHRHTNVDAQEAVIEAMRDIAMHELAVAAAMQTAVRELLAGLAPDKITRGIRSTKFDELIGNRKQKGWDAYVARHAEVTRALSDNFDSAFGRSFARAYEAALKETSAASDWGDRT